MSAVIVGGRVVAAVGWKLWNGGRVAHMSGLTRPDVRGRGYGSQAARHATARVVELGYVAQWRAASQNVGSRRIADRLGYTHFGSQLSLRFPLRPAARGPREA